MKRRMQCTLVALAAVMIVFILAPLNAWSADTESQFKAAIAAGDEMVTGGKVKEALVEYLKAVKLKPNDADAYYKVGVANYFLPDYPAAVEAYKKSIELNPKHFKALNNLGMIYDKENKDREATEMFARSLAADPGYKKARYNLGRVLYKRKLLNQAENVATELLKAFPDDEEGSYLLGLIYEHSDRYNKAKEMFTKAARLSTLNKDCEESLKRLGERMKAMEPKKADLEKARTVVNFKLPNGYEFLGFQQLPGGMEMVTVTCQTGCNMLVTKLPETSKLNNPDMQKVLSKPDEETLKFFADLGLTDIVLVEMKQMDLDNPEIDADASTQVTNKHSYARITCTAKGQKNEGMVTLVPGKGNNPLLYVAVAPEGRFEPVIARIFLVNIGN